MKRVTKGFTARRLPRPAMCLAAALAAGACFAAVPASAATATTATAGLAAQAPSSMCPGANVAAFGPNVCIFNDTMSQATIQADLNNIATQQVPVASQFDSQRYAIFFQPGTYGSAADPLVFQVGYYTEVAGLGSMPQDTVIDGAIDVFNNLCTAGTSDCNSDDNFWRSLSNLDLNVDLPSSPPAYAPPVLDAYGAGCANSAEIWSASQAIRSGAPSSAAASSSRTTARRTTTPAAALSRTARSAATSISTVTSSTWSGTAT